MGYFYDVFQVFEESMNNSDLYNTDWFHNFPVVLITTHLTENLETQKNFQIPGTLEP